MSSFHLQKRSPQETLLIIINETRNKTVARGKRLLILSFFSKIEVQSLSEVNKMTKYKICGVTGHRPKGFPWDYNDKNCNAHKDYLSTMEKQITKLITEQGFNYFIAGGAIGVDTDFAETVLRLRDTSFPDIKLEIAVPCENQELKWNEEDKKRYHSILERADIVNVLAKGYTSFCMQKRNEYMVKKSHFFLAFWNGEKKGGTWNTIHFMEKKKFDFELFNLSMFTDSTKAVEAFLTSLIEGDPEKSKALYEEMKKY